MNGLTPLEIRRYKQNIISQNELRRVLKTIIDFIEKDKKEVDSIEELANHISIFVDAKITACNNNIKMWKNLLGEER